MLRVGQRLTEALRVGETMLQLAERTFPRNHPSLAFSYERLGQIYDQLGQPAEARPHLIKALRIIEGTEPADQPAIHRLARRAAYLSDVPGHEEEAITFYEQAIQAATALGNVSHSDLGTMLNNVALIYRRTGRQKSGRALLQTRARARPETTRTRAPGCRRRLEQSRSLLHE